MSLTALMPVFNEEKTLEAAVDRVVQQPLVKQLVIVDDGSVDNTPKILKVLAEKYPKKIITFRQKNQGKGAAVRTALQHATQPYVVIQDADLEYDPADLAALYKPIQEGKAEVVFGSRFLGTHSNLLFWHYVGNTFLNFLVNLLYNTTLSDMETCYKMMPTATLRALELTSRDFRIEPEITCKLLLRGVRIVEVPISYFGRDFTQGKKITWRDGIMALGTIFGLRFT